MVRLVTILMVGGWAVQPLSVTASPQPALETVIELRVHGNQRLSDDEIHAWAEVTVGDQVAADIDTVITRRLMATGQFESVEVRKRYRSLTANDELALVVVVMERAVSASAHPVARFFGEFRQQALLLPILDYTEGYGMTYGVRTSFVDLLGSATRLSIPATWGGSKQIALEVDTLLPGPVIDRVQGGIGRTRSQNPHFGIDADRTELWVRADRRFPGQLQASIEAGWGDVRFGSRDDSIARYRIGLEVDTRHDPVFPRNAVRALASFEWLDVADTQRAIGRLRYGAEGYAGLFGQSVFAIRAGFVGADHSVPAYEQPLLGGGSSLRGWGVGDFIGDRRVHGSAELRVPFSSPLSLGRTGVTVFYDTGTAFDVGQSVDDARFRHGVGLGVFLHAAVVRLRVDVAHNLVGAVRAHVGASLSF